jgi:hypothetical protein
MLEENTPVIGPVRKYDHIGSESVAAYMRTLPSFFAHRTAKGVPNRNAEFRAASVVTTMRADSEHQIIERFTWTLHSAQFVVILNHMPTYQRWVAAGFHEDTLEGTGMIVLLPDQKRSVNR